MSDQPIAAEVVEAAIEAFVLPELTDTESLWRSMEAAIRAADEARGLRVEEERNVTQWGWPLERRIVGPWVPVGGETQDTPNAVRGDGG
jgi:hypothetical protein